jgi:signal transduction histidine kinase
MGDQVQIQQVIINLFTNSLEVVKDQPLDDRRIQVSSQAEKHGVEVRINDSGPGIPVSRLESVFEPFQSTKATGMGMGLTICRSILEAHGGKIWAENNADGGARVSFWLPEPGESS